MRIEEFRTADSIDAEMTFEGLVNGQRVDGIFRGLYDPNHNINGCEMELTDIEELENALLASSCTSNASSTFSLFSTAVDGARNLNSMFDDRFQVDVDFRMIDPSTGLLIGAMDQVVEGRIQNKSIGVKVRCEGWYKGPRDLFYSPGYATYLRQVDVGKVEGTYGQTVYSRSGKHIYVFSRRLYSYDTTLELEFDEVWTYRLLDLKISTRGGKRIFDYIASSYYSPAQSLPVMPEGQWQLSQRVPMHGPRHHTLWDRLGTTVQTPLVTAAFAD